MRWIKMSWNLQIQATKKTPKNNRRRNVTESGEEKQPDCRKKEEKVQQRVKHKDNNTLKLYRDDRINVMFYAATDWRRDSYHLSLVYYAQNNLHRVREVAVISAPEWYFLNFLSILMLFTETYQSVWHWIFHLWNKKSEQNKEKWNMPT